jgi:hypothetical protein
MAKLQWETLDSGEIRAKDNPYEFVIWSPRDPKRPTELRLIRKDNVGGIIAPFQDFSVFARDKRSAIKLAQRLAKELSKARRYNGYINL